MPAAEETYMDPTAAVYPSWSDDDVDVDPIITPPLLLHAMMESFMTTQTAHG